MSKILFMFSGQGSQYSGMGKELCEQFVEAKEIYELASDTFGMDIKKISFEGTPEELSQTIISQPVIYTLSMAAYSVLSANGVAPQGVAGFSLGECSALTAAGVMDIETGFKVICARATAMENAASSAKGAMFAIIGCDTSQIEEACGSVGGYVLPVNYNCTGQIVIAGDEEYAVKASDILKEAGAKVVRLAVNSAFHSRLMEGAAADFSSKLTEFSFSPAKIPVYSNITGSLYNIDNIPAYLAKQMISPVRFSDELISASNDGYDLFVELGPSKTLCGFVRKTLKGAKFANVEDVKSLNSLLAILNSKL
jgi:[acyl-carrier-protein] S-malonyltransferase